MRHRFGQPLPALALAGLALAAVIASAFAHGGETLTGQALVLAAGAPGFAALALEPAPGRWPLAIRAAALAWGGLAIWCWLQAAPLGLGVHPVWPKAVQILAEAQAGAIALDPQAAREASLRLAAYAGLFALGLSATAAAAKGVVMPALAGAIAAVCAISLMIGDNQGPAGLAKVRHWGDAAYPFANRNHLCVFAGLGVLAAAAGLLDRTRKPGWQAALLLAALLACLAAALATHSRAGLAAIVAGGGVLLVLARGNRAATLGLAAAGAIGLAFAAGTFARLESLPEAAALRFDIITEAFRLALQRPWLGQGRFDLAFQAVSPAYAQGMVQSAHNILAESLVERGWPATALAVLALALVLGQCARSAVGSGAGKVQSATAIGAATMVLLHGMVDFSLHAPTVAALVAFMLGLGAGHAHRSAPAQAGEMARGNPPEGARA